MQQPPQGYGPPPGQGYAPQGYPPPGYGPPQPMNYNPPPKKSNGCLIAGLIGGGILVLGFGGCLAFCGAGIKGAADKQKKEEQAFEDEKPKAVTPAEMLSAYKKNEVAGDEQFKGKKLKITGTVASIDSGIGDEPIVRLGDSNAFESVMLHDIPKAEAAKLEKGKKITAVCKGDGEIIGSPVLRKCKLE